MTVLDNIQSILYTNDELKQTLLNNSKIENKLHVIMVISNPCQYKRRIILANEFIKRMEKNSDIILYIVEMIYKCNVDNIDNKYSYQVTSSDNIRHLQLYTEVPLWHKENMINLGIEKLLPKDWKAVAWIDADISFENINWASDTLKILNGYKDIVQLYSMAIDMNKNEGILRMFYSFGHQYQNNKQYVKNGPEYWHSGFCWAMNRNAYKKMNKLYEYSILGSGDINIALSVISNGQKSINQDNTDDYKESLYNFEQKIQNLRLGYVPGLIKHYYHGSKINRKYQERWTILVSNRYQPTKHVKRDSNGILVPTDKFPKKLKDDILLYFQERKEDD